MSGHSIGSGQSLYFEAAHTFCKCRRASPFSGMEALVHGLPLFALPIPFPSSFSMRWFSVLKVKLNLLLSFSRKIAECSVSNYVYLQFDGGFFVRMITSGSSTDTTGGKLVGGRGTEG